MMYFIRISIKLFLLFFMRAFAMTVVINLGMILILLFRRFVFNADGLDIYGHDAISAALGTYIALKTTYWVEGEPFRILSKEFGINPNKFDDKK